MKYVALLLALGLAAPCVALADPAVAKMHYERGTTAYALGRFDEAAREYELAFEAKADPSLLYNAAQAYRLGNNKARALLLYQNYLRVFPNVQNRDEVERHIRNLTRSIESERQTASEPPVTPAPASSAVANATTPPPRSPSLAPMSPEPATTVTARPAATPAPAAAVAVEVQSSPQAPRKRSLVWVAGVVVAVVVVGGAVGVGVGVGASGSPRDPSPSLGGFAWQ